MASRRKLTLGDLPEAGTVFAMPLADGRTGICRVIRTEEQGGACALVAASDWIGNEPPPLDDPAIRRILIKNHHSWAGKQDLLWVSTPPPKEFRSIGKIDVTSADLKLDSAFYGHWDSLQTQVLAQWRWEHDRTAVLAEDEAKENLSAAKRTAAERKRLEYLATVSLSDLLGKDLFPTWLDYPPQEAKESCQKTIQQLIHRLNEAEKPLTRNLVGAELKKCVQELNRLDSENNNFIESVERDDICEVLEDVVNAAIFPDLIEKIGEWRDW
jgi:hypothetical protein